MTSDEAPNATGAERPPLPKPRFASDPAFTPPNRTFAAFQEGTRPRPVVSSDRFGAFPSCSHPTRHHDGPPGFDAYDVVALEALDVCISGSHLTGDDVAGDVAVYLCDWLIGKATGAHWVTESTYGWSWLWVTDGIQLDPFRTVARSLQTGEPIAVRFCKQAIFFSREGRHAREV